MPEQQSIPDATWLFEGRDPTSKKRLQQWQHSEHWWTALFSLVLLTLPKERRRFNLFKPVLVNHGNYFDFEHADGHRHFDLSGTLDLSEISFSSLLIEARIGRTVFEGFLGLKGEDWPLTELTLEPDITLAYSEDGRKNIYFIENKTVRGRSGRLECYLEVAKKLSMLRDTANNMIDAQVFVLLSNGNDKNDIWGMVKDRRVLLWEDILQRLNTESSLENIKMNIFGFDLKPYYEQIVT